MIYRVWRVMNRSFIGIVCWVVSISRFIGSVAAGIEAFLSPSIAHFAIRWGWLVTAVLVSSAFVDVVIAVSLCYFLITHRDNTAARQESAAALLSGSILTRIFS